MKNQSGSELFNPEAVPVSTPPAPDPHPREEAERLREAALDKARPLRSGNIYENWRQGFDAAMALRTPPPAVADGEDKAILDWLAEHIEHANGFGVSLNKWMGGATEIYVLGVCFEGPTLRAAILSAMRTGGSGK